jgi:hypothetical protein
MQALPAWSGVTHSSVESLANIDKPPEFSLGCQT